MNYRLMAFNSTCLFAWNVRAFFRFFGKMSFSWLRRDPFWVVRNKITGVGGNFFIRSLQVTGLDLPFYPNFRKIHFWGIFPIMCQIRLSYPFSVRKILLRTKIRMKTRIWHVGRKSNLRNCELKSDSKPVTCPLSQAFPDKTVTLPLPSLNVHGLITVPFGRSAIFHLPIWNCFVEIQLIHVTDD